MRAAQKNEARFRLLADSTPDIVIWCDLAMVQRQISPVITAVLGYAPDDLIGKHIVDFIHPAEAKTYKSLLFEFIRGDVPSLITLQRYRHHDGRWVGLEIACKLTHDPTTGHADGCVAALRDVSARRLTEEALHHADDCNRARIEAKLQAAQAQIDVTVATSSAILAQLAEGVIVTDASGRITLVNAAAAAIHGAARLDVTPDAYTDTYHLFTEDGRPYPPGELPLARAVDGESVRDARWRIHRADGVEVLAIGSAQPLLGSGGGQIGAVLTLRDDTARDAAERSLRDLNATLNARVAERTREAEAARGEAEAGSRAKSEFLATMSHEIRTPLNGVIGYAELLSEMAELAPTARLYAERIRGAGAALLTVLDDILDFSKIEAGQIEITCRPFALGGLIDGALAIVRGSAEAKGLAVTTNLGSDLPSWVSGDEDRLRQILLNLLGNAVKFTRAGWVALTAEKIALQDEGTSIRFAVTDTGTGIPINRHDRLFQSFSQVDSSIARSYGGTGLGLAICRRLVELMGGTIGFESQPGIGSTFWFTLTLPEAEPDVAIPAPSSLAARRVGKYILLAEDVLLNQELACTILRRAGHEVDVVSDGAAAVAAVRTRSYDLVLMDIQMPVLDGLEALRQIRALKGAAAHMPIVAITANVLPEQVAAIMAAGASGHVGKPYRADALLEVIERLTQGPAGSSELAPMAQQALDEATLDPSIRSLGKAQIQELLMGLAAELENRFMRAGPLPDRDVLAFDAHATVAAADMLGFRKLAYLCRATEQACKIGEDYGPILENLRRCSADTISQITSRRIV